MPISLPLHLVRRLADRRVRARWLTRLMASRAVHQDTTATWYDRYPSLFGACRVLLGDGAAPHILSFGCSSGEEVLSLRHYFPDATIVGAEINRHELAASRTRAAGPKITFIRSTRPAIAAQGPYDAVFCMAVLQRRPHAVERAGLTSIAHLYPFAKFDDEIAFLSAQLRTGGLLVVEHTQYRVEDSRAAGRLVPATGFGNAPPTGPRFDRAGALIQLPVAASRIFQKI